MIVFILTPNAEITAHQNEEDPGIFMDIALTARPHPVCLNSVQPWSKECNQAVPKILIITEFTQSCYFFEKKRREKKKKP